MSPPRLAAGLFLLVCLVGADSGPVWPIPSDLWKPQPGSTPRKGNFVYLNSQPGDCVGGGLNYSYTPLNAYYSVEQVLNFLAVSIQGNEQQNGNFQPMSSLTMLERGYYEVMDRFPFNNPSEAGFFWNGGRCACSNLTGWFAVDKVTYKGGNLNFISLRFEQHCEGANPALRGALRWDINDHQEPNGPTEPPRGLWTPPKAAISSGNYVYLESQQGDSVGRGQNYSYNSSNALIVITQDNYELSVEINGDQQWYGNFQGMGQRGSALRPLQKGYYGEIQANPFNNPVLAGLSWGNCNGSISGWFMIDEVTYNASEYASLKLRFAQHCDEATPALYGALSWSANNPPNHPVPVYPPPAGLWTPPQNSVPSTGNYVYLESDPGDYIGEGLNYTYTPDNASFSLSNSNNYLSLQVNGNDPTWGHGDFKGMQGITELQVGFYGGLQRYPYNDPRFGGFQWYGNGNACDFLLGWFVVDAIEFASGEISEVRLRFEQHCEEAIPALHGAISWKASTSLF